MLLHVWFTRGIALIAGMGSHQVRTGISRQTQLDLGKAVPKPKL
jgi:hypothetical protein